MNSSTIFRLLMAVVLLYGSMLFVPGVAHADDVECQASVPGGINFGAVDPSNPAAVTSQANLDYSCTNNSTTAYYITACFNIGYGPEGLSTANDRQMAGPGAGKLRFQLYRDGARSQIWGSVAASNPYSTPVRVQFRIPARTRSGWFGPLSPPVVLSNPVPTTVYARIPGSQAGVTAGPYTTTFNSAQLKITGYANTGSYSNDCGTSGDDAGAFSSFPVSAVVAPTCTVTATDMNFGNATGLLASGNHDGTSSIGVTCVSGTQYKIGLNDGLHANGNIRRMLGPGGQLIRYELYSNAGRTTRWGNTPTVDTVNKAGNGSSQAATVYGRVPAQTTPRAGTYNDTITVTVTY